MTMTASHLVRNDDGTWAIDELGFTPCECDFEKPSWHIATSRTTLDLEAERASLLFPTIYVWKVPVLWFPWLSLPLSDRQTGLLVPKPNFSALNGFTLEQPVFITLGRTRQRALEEGGGDADSASARQAAEEAYAQATRIAQTTGDARASGVNSDGQHSHHHRGWEAWPHAVLELVALERIDLIADKASYFHLSTPVDRIPLERSKSQRRSS